MNKINCAEKLTEVLASLRYDPELCIIETECHDSWNEDGAIFLVYFTEDDYRDYDALKRDVVNDIAEKLGDIHIVYNQGKYPDSGYVLRVQSKNGLWIEVEFHRVENGKAVSTTDLVCN